MNGPSVSRGTGAVKFVTSVSNPIVKDLRALHLKKYRDAQGRFLAEGLQSVVTGLESGWSLRVFGFAVKMAEHPLVMNTAAKCKARGGLVLQLNEKVLAKITRRDNPQMVIGVFDQVWTPLDAVDEKTSSIWIGLDRIRDPGNLGTIARTADAVGATGLILIGGTCDPYSVEAVRATMGSIFQVKMARASEDEFARWRKSWPGLVIGTQVRDGVNFRSIAYTEPALLLMGSEQSGLADQLADTCDSLVHIPQVGQAESLNVAVCAGILLYEMRRGAQS
jgi:TrmH family RNA methyltransferase